MVWEDDVVLIETFRLQQALRRAKLDKACDSVYGLGGAWHRITPEALLSATVAFSDSIFKRGVCLHPGLRCCKTCGLAFCR